MYGEGRVDLTKRCDACARLVGISAIELAEGNPPNWQVPAMKAMMKIPMNPPPLLAGMVGTAGLPPLTFK